MLFKSTDLKICERTFFKDFFNNKYLVTGGDGACTHFNFNAVQLQRKFRNQKHLLPKC